MAAYKLTVRHGSRVERESFSLIDDAIAALEERVKEIRSSGPLQPRKMIREYEPGVQVAGRVTITYGSTFLRRGDEAGVDVMGDGSLVAFAGGTGRIELDPGRDGPFAAVRQALEG